MYERSRTGSLPFGVLMLFQQYAVGNTVNQMAMALHRAGAWPRAAQFPRVQEPVGGGGAGEAGFSTLCSICQGPWPGFEGLCEYADRVSHICSMQVFVFVIVFFFFLGKRTTASSRFSAGSETQRHLRLPDSRESPGPIEKDNDYWGDPAS